jgi:hypothetical protein
MFIEIKDRLRVAEFTFLLVADMVFRRAVVFLTAVFTFMRNNFVLFPLAVAT